MGDVESKGGKISVAGDYVLRIQSRALARPLPPSAMAGGALPNVERAAGNRGGPGGMTHPGPGARRGSSANPAGLRLNPVVARLAALLAGSPLAFCARPLRAPPARPGHGPLHLVSGLTGLFVRRFERPVRTRSDPLDRVLGPVGCAAGCSPRLAYALGHPALLGRRRGGIGPAGAR